MASLSTALNHALTGLSLSSGQTALVSRNISSAGDDNYTRRTAEIHILPGGMPSVSGIKRSTNHQLLDKLMISNSEACSKQVMLDALARISALVGDPEDEQSIAAAIGGLQQSLRAYEANPGSNALGRAAVEAAKAVVLKINTSAAEAASIRDSADTAMAESTQRINSLLAQFKVVNDSIVRGQGTADELAENLDQRDSILKLLSEEISIRTSTRPNNDLLIYADGGAVLFEGTPRAVTFTPSPGLHPGVAGDAIYVDGVAVTGEGAPMPTTGGRIAALAAVRDTVGVQFSQQLDQIAAGLIRGFAEKAAADSSPWPDVEGLFTGTGSLPVPGETNAGLSALIRVNALSDPEKGGSVSLLRDGGFGGTAYVHNTLAFPGYQTRLTELSDAIDTIQGFGTIDGIGGSVSVKDLSLQSASWIGRLHQAAQSSLDAAVARQSRANDALTRVTGVNIDQEMASLLDLEKSYQASSKVLGIVNSMMNALFEAVD